MPSHTSIVITSISGADNPVLKEYSEKSAEKGHSFIVIGDRKSPADFKLEGCEYYNFQSQSNLNFKLASLLPENSYARKNLGYLLAIHQGSSVIIETDDDNIPLEEFWEPRDSNMQGQTADKSGWVNVYSYFSDAFVWPRGFPIENLHDKTIPPLGSLMTHYCPIQQGLADANPDVDALFRLTRELPVNFKKREAIILRAGTYCPFNSQNTTWFREVFPLLYVPSTCNFRVCDIWRSFVARAVLSANNWNIGFHAATVRQERNEHDLLHDFENEIPGFLHNQRIMSELASLPLKSGKEFIPENMRLCYKRLLALGLVSEKEINLLAAWLDDLARQN